MEREERRRLKEKCLKRKQLLEDLRQLRELKDEPKKGLLRGLREQELLKLLGRDQDDDLGLLRLR